MLSQPKSQIIKKLFKLDELSVSQLVRHSFLTGETQPSILASLFKILIELVRNSFWRIL